MQYKHRARHRDKFPKVRYRVTNSRDYNESLRRRGDVTIWIGDYLAGTWKASRRKSPGGQPGYSDLAIEICLNLHVVFGLALRQTQGFVRSLMKLSGLDLEVPDYTTLSRQNQALKIKGCRSAPGAAGMLVVDSTGLSIHTGRAWHHHKHGGVKPRKSWRKLHVGLDPDSGDIITSGLTEQETGDVGAVPDLLDKLDDPIIRFIADGAYDGAPLDTRLRARFGADVEIIIPPPANAVYGQDRYRNQRIREIREKGRTA